MTIHTLTPTAESRLRLLERCIDDLYAQVPIDDIVDAGGYDILNVEAVRLMELRTWILNRSIDRMVNE